MIVSKEYQLLYKLHNSFPLEKDEISLLKGYLNRVKLQIETEIYNCAETLRTIKRKTRGFTSDELFEEWAKSLS